MEDEPFTLELACELIGGMPQDKGFKAVHREGGNDLCN